MHSLTHSFETKTFIGSLIVIISYIVSHAMDEVFIILAAFMALDYLTGVLCGLIRNGGFKYRKGINGIIKKLMYLVLILVTVLLEFLIDYLTVSSKITIQTDGAITLAMYIYLIGTEGLSIIQNLIILGIPVPPFMIKIFGLVRDQSGNLIKK